MIIDAIKWILIIAAWIIIATAVYAGFSSAPWLPTRKKVLKKMLEELDIKESDQIIDLGCGTGSVLFAIKSKYPKSQCIGYEISIFPYLIAQCKNLFRASKIQIKYKNLFTADISSADHLFIFLMPKSYKRLKEKVIPAIKGDAKVIIEAWPLSNADPEKVIRPEGDLPVYVYNGKIVKEAIK